MAENGSGLVLQSGLTLGHEIDKNIDRKLKVGSQRTGSTWPMGIS